MRGLILGVFASLSFSAAAAPACLDNQGNDLPINNAAVLQWKASSKDGYHARGHIEGQISRLYKDATGHYHWEATIGSGADDTIEIVYDIKFGKVPTPKIGTPIEACGDYITARGKRPSPDGALIHWVHGSDNSKHPDGFIVLNGQEYGDRSGFSTESASVGQVKGFSQVVDGIYRGARPSADDLSQLVDDYGVHTDVDLESKQKNIDPEQATAEGLGLKFISNPFDSSVTPKDADVNQVLAELQDKTSYPLYIHCHHGEDRTGLMIGLYRVEVQKWSPEQAYKEMLANGFHPAMHALDDYFRQRTGYSK